MSGFQLMFSECEHQEDLYHYLEDIKSSGGRILDAQVREEETALVLVDAPNKAEFIEKFEQTESHDFLI